MDVVDIIRGKLGRYPLIKRILTPFNLIICDYRKRKRYKKFQKNQDELFIKIVRTFKEENLKCWVEFGTLLGIYRDHGFIPGDDDFDFGAFVDDVDKIKEALARHGFTLLKEYEAENNPLIKELTYIDKGVTFDIFCFTKTDKYNSCYIFALSDVDILAKKKRYKVKQYNFPIFDLKTINFMGENVFVPSDIEMHLEYSYGKSFMIPDPHFNSIHSDYMEGVVAIDKQECITQ